MAADMFNKFKSSLNRGITTISVKASSTLEKTKLKTHIDTLEKEIEKLYINAGELSYKIWKGEASDNEALKGYFEVISQKLDEICALEKEISEIDERGSEILGAEDSVTEAKCVCPNCGAAYTEAVNFCRQCGSKMEQ